MTAEFKAVVPHSILDTDLYKLTMQQAIQQHFPESIATYRFTHRSKGVYFSQTCIDRFRASLPHFASLTLSTDERQFLERRCPYLKPEYLDYLQQYRFKPEQVTVTFSPIPEAGEGWGNVEIEAAGPWIETIMWEVPLMACLSETYFLTDDTDWNYDGQLEDTHAKATTLLAADCAVSEFGTRRRRSYHIQNLVVAEFKRASTESSRGKLTGTSNVHLAMKYDVSPVGTIAHEWFMGVAALRGYEHGNSLALNLWEDVYGKHLLIALTDTFSTKAFFQDFTADRERAERWSGLRQDSGDPFAFAPKAREIYTSLGIDHASKMIVYSDALTVDKVLDLKRQCDQEGFKSSFGIGTSLTNDFKKASSGGTEKSKALNMVIKLSSIDGKPCVKISDDLDKNTGDAEAVARIKKLFSL